mmetsp:Transcript_42237/g.96837  ORF Transcript_42237/g.96837 Transcript_42237/m.96837 type:complete len:226 (+) Transcript_42237:655-1332(+)
MCIHPAARCVRTSQLGHGRVCVTMYCASGDWWRRLIHLLRCAHEAGKCGSSEQSTQNSPPHRQSTSGGEAGCTHAATWSHPPRGHTPSSELALTKLRTCSFSKRSVSCGRSIARQRRPAMGASQPGCGQVSFTHAGPRSSAACRRPPQQSAQKPWPQCNECSGADAEGSSKQMPQVRSRHASVAATSSAELSAATAAVWFHWWRSNKISPSAGGRPETCWQSLST